MNASDTATFSSHRIIYHATIRYGTGYGHDSEGSVVDLVFVLIGKADEIQPMVKKYAPVIDTKSISQPGF